MGKQPSEAVILRLPFYLRALSILEEEGREWVVSEKLGEMLGLTSAQVRKDLNLFGKFGKQGTGYLVKPLKEKLEKILKSDRPWNVIVVGLSEMGRVILSAKRFQKSIFKIISAFDKDGKMVGKTINGIKVRHLDELEEVVKREGVKLAILTLPSDSPPQEVQEITDRLIKCQIEAILNYTFVLPSIPSHVKIKNMDPIAALQSMTYYLGEEFDRKNNTPYIR